MVELTVRVQQRSPSGKNRVCKQEEKVEKPHCQCEGEVKTSKEGATRTGMVIQS